MTKFDHRSQLPSLFSENKLSILPISRGSYLIGHFDTFLDFESLDAEEVPFEFPSYIESLDFNDITSESTAINCSFISKILHDFVGEQDLAPTVSGRMSSSVFSFDINDNGGLFTVNVSKAQLEIDGGYEGGSSLCLIEAKNYISSDFLVRQLFYPCKLWTGRVRKKVRPIFLSYSNGVFHFREYAFDNLNYYNSIYLVNEKKYVIHDGHFNMEVLLKILDETEVLPEPQVPFPQANSFERVVNLCELLNNRGPVSKEDITDNFDFDPRQTDYYSNAGRYLGLIDSERDENIGQVNCYLTKLGEKTLSYSLFERKKQFVKLIISYSVFKQVLVLYLESGEMPDREKIVEVMKGAGLYNIGSKKTFNRRASTIVGWINWVVSQIEE